MDSIYAQSKPDDLSQVIASMQADAVQEKTQEAAAAKVAAQKDNLQDQQDDGNPLAAALKGRDKKITPHTATVKKAKETKEGQKKILPPKEIAEEFTRKNPQFNSDRLVKLTEKLKDGMTKQQILALIHEEYPNPIEASLVLDFLVTVSYAEYKEFLQSIQTEMTSEIFTKRQEEVAKKVEAEAVRAAQEASEAGLKIAQQGNLHELYEFLVANPSLEAPAIYKMLDDGYGEKMMEIEKFLINETGTEQHKLKTLKDDLDKNRLVVVLISSRKILANVGVDIYFEKRNPPDKPEKAAKPQKVAPAA